jgi:uncharacterized surface protein with fasciclin (FAS1) repeats
LLEFGHPIGNPARTAYRSTDCGVWVNNATVSKTVVMCSNGVIHWIDAVVMPPEK